MSEGFRDRFDITPQQYHAGLDKLWTALGNDVDYSGQNIFDAIPQEISRLKRELELVRKSDQRHWKLAMRNGAEAEKLEQQLAESAAMNEQLQKERDELQGMFEGLEANAVEMEHALKSEIKQQAERIKELEEGIQAIVDEFAEMTSDIRIELKKLLREESDETP